MMINVLTLIIQMHAQYQSTARIIRITMFQKKIVEAILLFILIVRVISQSLQMDSKK